MVECRSGNNSGACFPFFDGVDRMTKQLQSVSKECIDDIKSHDEVRDGIWKSTNFIFELAWGPKPPKSEYERLSWFDHLNLSIYCNLRGFIFNNYNKDTWDEFREKVLASLPGASELGREKTWKFSLFTLNCNAINGQPQ